MSLQSFTRGFEDRSDEYGYKFAFKCDICSAVYVSKYVEAKSNKKRDFVGISSRAFSLGSSLLSAVPMAGKPDLASTDQKQKEFSSSLSERFKAYSPEWQKGHDQAFELAQKEAKKNFHNCHLCKRWVCENDWNDQRDVCAEDVKESLCPNCRQRPGSSKFCTNCGFKLEMKCNNCGASIANGVKFCGECGTKLLE
ncbi:MAG: zinc ribbon domain-containing protein [Nitrososphaera sp.]